MALQVMGTQGTKDSEKNREKVSGKLCKDGLEVIVTDCSTPGLFLGKFSISGKPISFSKSKKKEGEEKEATKSPMKVEEVSVAKVEEKKSLLKKEESKVEATSSIGEKSKNSLNVESLPMFSVLPSLKLLEGVRIEGGIPYISDEGRIWFSPRWAQDKLGELSERLESLPPLPVVAVTDVVEGLLCVAKHTDDCLYRARVVKTEKIGALVDFFDYGNYENVAEVLGYPVSLGLELAPAAAEVFPVRLLPTGTNRVNRLENFLMGELGEKLVELQIEEDKETKRMVARFYENGEEIVFDNKIETKLVFEKTSTASDEDQEDVIIESVEDIQPTVVKKKNVSAVVSTSSVNVGKIIDVKLVEGEAFPTSGRLEVVVVLVESVARVWVQRKVEEAKISKLITALEKMVHKLNKVENAEVGCVYGTRFSEDGNIVS